MIYFLIVPYLTLAKIMSNGLCLLKGYGATKPLVILPYNDGQKLKKEIDKLAIEYKYAKEQLEKNYMAKLKEIAPFIDKE